MSEYILRNEMYFFHYQKAKMISNISQKFAAMRRPRPAHNVDCLRCLINYVDASMLSHGFGMVRCEVVLDCVYIYWSDNQSISCYIVD